MQDFFQSAPCGFVSFDVSGKILAANDRLSDLVRQRSDFLRGENIESLLAVGSRLFFQASVLPMLKLNGQAEEIYLLLRSRGGEETPVLFSAARNKFSADRFDCVIMPVRQRNQFEDEMIRARRDAEEATRAKDQAYELLKRNQEELAESNAALKLAVIETHHRVKNNLQLVTAMVEIQAALARDSGHRDQFHRLGHYIASLAVVQDLLTQAAKGTGPNGVISARDLIEQLLPLHRSDGAEREIHARLDELRMPGRQGASLALMANELITNAIKHGRPPVAVEMIADGDFVRISVADSGKGFEKSFSGEAANTGLQLVESLVAWDLKGAVNYSTRPEGGAIVTVAFPRPSA